MHAAFNACVAFHSFVIFMPAHNLPMGTTCIVHVHILQLSRGKISGLTTPSHVNVCLQVHKPAAAIPSWAFKHENANQIMTQAKWRSQTRFGSRCQSW
jgi:hypothetical protein